MLNEELEAITNSIKSKLGDDNMGLIADDIGTLITKNAETLNTLKQKDDELTKLRDDKEKLIIANGNLLQQVGFNSTSTAPKEEEEKPTTKNIDFRSFFDKRGTFKK